MIQYGLVHEVRLQTWGSYLAADAALGASTLVLDDALDFNEDGGSANVGGVTYAYTASDPEANTMTLGTTLPGLVETGTRVDALPLTTEKQAIVVIADADEAVTVRVPHAYFDLLPEGIREETDRESVAFDTILNELVLTDVLGKTPTVDGSHIDPGTLPPFASDGIAPSNSPTPTVVGGLGAIFIRWDPITNHDPVEYEVHVSTSSGFTPDGTNLAVITAGGSYTYRPSAPDYAATYYVKVVATDEDGAASPSAEASAQMVQVTGPDISAGYVYAGSVSAVQILAGELTADLTITGSLKTATTGQRVEIDTAGISLVQPDGTVAVQLPTHPTDAVPPFIRGQFIAESMTVEDKLELQGLANEMAVGSELLLAYQPGDPTSAPIATPGIPTHASGIPADESFHTPTGWAIGNADEYHSWAFYDDSGIYKRATGATTAGTEYRTATATPGADDFVVGALTHVYETAATEERLIAFGKRKSDGAYCFRKWDITAWPPTKVTDYSYDSLNVWHRVGLGPSVNDNEFCLAQVTNDNKIRFRRYSATGSSLSQTTSVASTEIANGSVEPNIYGAMYGDFGLGVGNLYCAFLRDRVWFYNPADGTRPAQYAFYTQTNVVLGTHSINASRDYVAFKAIETGPTPRSFDYTEFRKDVATGLTIYAVNTWYDSVGTTHETKASKSYRQFVMPKRGQVILSVPSIPVGAAGADDPDSVRFYLGTSSANGSLWSQDSPPAPGVLSQTLTNPRVATGGGAVNPPVTNSFPTQTPAKIKAPSGTLSIQGDGQILAGPGAGDLTRLQKIVLTSWYQSGYGNFGDDTVYPISQAWYDAARKFIFCEFLVKRTSDTTASIFSMATVPSQYRPALRISTVCANTVGGTENMARVTLVAATGSLDLVFAANRLWTATTQFCFANLAWKVA